MDPGPEVHDFLVKHLADLGVHPAIEHCSVGRENLMQIVSLGRGLTLTREATVATRFPGVVYKQLRGEMLPFSAVWSPCNDNGCMIKVHIRMPATGMPLGVDKDKFGKIELKQPTAN